MSLSRCVLCPHQCGVDRGNGDVGACRSGRDPVLYRYGPHHGEEPPVSGHSGSGTLFFSHCTLKCLYCQNYPWSQLGEGDVYDEAGLVQALHELAAAGCHNWNLVSPTPWLPWIEEAVLEARRSGVDLPVVFNTSGYERVETLERYGDALGQVYVADLRYADAETGLRASGVPDYPEVARQALKTMWQQRGPLVLDENGVAICGVICRLLILPGRAEEAVSSLRWLAQMIGPEISLSVMAQYRPAHKAMDAAEDWNRRITLEEYEQVCETVDQLGFENGWIQAWDDETDDDLVGHQMPRGSFLAEPEAC